MLSLYHGLFVPIFRYGLILWGGSSKANMNRVFSQQKEAIRILARLDYRETCKQTFLQLGLLTLPAIYIYDCIIFVIKNKFGETVGETTGRVTRQSENFYLPSHRIDKTTESASFMGLKLFNSLPSDLKAAKGEKKFGEKLKQHLLSLTIYSVDQFLPPDLK